MGMKNIKKRQKVGWTMSFFVKSDQWDLSIWWLVYHSDESAVQEKKRPAWAPNFFLRIDKEMYHFVGQKIIIEEALDSYAGMIWPAVSITFATSFTSIWHLAPVCTITLSVLCCVYVITVITVLQCQSRIRLLGYIYNSARGLSKRPDNHLLIYKDALYISLLLLWLAHTSSKSRHKDTHFSFEL